MSVGHDPRYEIEHKRVHDLEDEIARLREELGRIVYRAKDLNEAEEIARTALKETT